MTEPDDGRPSRSCRPPRARSSCRAGDHVRARGGRPAGRRPCSCSTAGRPPPTSTCSPASPPSADASACSRSTIGATAAASARRGPFRPRGLRRRRRRAGRRARRRPPHPVGYSMGGPIAQLMWRRHPRPGGRPRAVRDGNRLLHGRDERLAFLGLAALAAPARMTPARRRDRLSGVYLGQDRRRGRPWAVEQVAHHDWTDDPRGRRAIGRFRSRSGSARSTSRRRSCSRCGPRRALPAPDPAVRVDPRRQPFRVDGDHDACVANAERFVADPRRACPCRAAPLACAPDREPTPADGVRPARCRSPLGLALSRRRRAAGSRRPGGGPDQPSRSPGATSSWPGSGAGRADLRLDGGPQAVRVGRATPPARPRARAAHRGGGRRAASAT